MSGGGSRRRGRLARSANARTACGSDFDKSAPDQSLDGVVIQRAGERRRRPRVDRRLRQHVADQKLETVEVESMPELRGPVVRDMLPEALHKLVLGLRPQEEPVRQAAVQVRQNRLEQQFQDVIRDA